MDILTGTSTDCNGNGVPDECEAPTCDSDITGDHTVDILDLFSLLESWGHCPAAGHAVVPGDSNDNSIINILDLTNLLEAWGACP